ncbi:hypothetical protein A3K55_00760 [Candidatus Shapirobacteria bacterium RBG_13_44_7]|uniref:ATP-grasp domain-containing protein n=1 Tax=Candidatus Shapirobacteria bacterium RBG_13_44_7 TaxID=1802149 RepID=A0A1F7SJ56_9BACT|nr:MAG: hypothetical protein A3K55_00760 [Candidatus Shapirobacteria bacterium RBG_13_44_7]
MTKQIVALTMSAKQSQFEVERLCQEAEKMGIAVKRVFYRDLSFEIGRSRVLAGGEEITKEKTMGIWFRVAGTKTGKYIEGRNLLIRLLQDGVFCVNARSYLGWPRMGKIAQHGVFVTKGIPVAETKIFYQKLQVGVGLEDWEFPIIAKHDRGYQGRSVRKFENWEEVEGFLSRIDEKNLGMFLWQKYIPGKWDLRIIVIDGKAIGAMKRSAVGEEFRSNYSLGGKVEEWKLTESERELAERVARVCELDYGGVDVMGGRVLEVNRQCQFAGFEKATGINVAKLVVEMILKKV